MRLLLHKLLHSSHTQNIIPNTLFNPQPPLQLSSLFPHCGILPLPHHGNLLVFHPKQIQIAQQQVLLGNARIKTQQCRLHLAIIGRNNLAELRKRLVIKIDTVTRIWFPRGDLQISYRIIDFDAHRLPHKRFIMSFCIRSFTAKLLLHAKKTVHLPEALYRYRVGQPSTMHNQNSRMNLDLLEIMEDLRESMDAEKDRDDFEFLVLNHVLLEAIKRVAAQKTPEREECLLTLRGYVKTQIPRLSASKSFREESRNRRLIMRLNYMGLHDLALMLLGIKKG